MDMSYANHSYERKCDSVFISLVVSISIPMIYRYNKQLELTEHARVSDVESSKQNTSKLNCNNKIRNFTVVFITILTFIVNSLTCKILVIYYRVAIPQ